MMKAMYAGMKISVKVKVDGKIVDDFGVLDLLGLNLQLGFSLVPPSTEEK